MSWSPPKAVAPPPPPPPAPLAPVVEIKPNGAKQADPKDESIKAPMSHAPVKHAPKRRAEATKKSHKR